MNGRLNNFFVIWTFLCVLCIHICNGLLRMVYRWTGGAIGRPEEFTPDKAVLGPKRTCFCCVRCISSICARSISKIIGAKRMVDELKTSHVAEHEYEYKPVKDIHTNVQFILVSH